NSGQWMLTKPAVFQLSAGNGTKTVRLWVKDMAGNVSGTATASILLNTALDSIKPTVSLITPSANGADNSSIKVSYWLSEPCQDVRLGFGTITTGSLTGGYGTNTLIVDGDAISLINGQTYTVSLSASDMNGNYASSTAANWTYDTEIASPSFYLMNKLTGSRIYTHIQRVDTSVSEHLEATGWLMSENSAVPAEEAVINTRPSEFTLSSGDGTKTVRLWCKDRAGNISPAATASIILNSNMDTTPPVVNLISPASGGVDDESVYLAYTVSEDAAAMALTFTRTNGTANGQPSYTLGTSYLLAGWHELMISGNTIGLQNGAVYAVSLRAVDAYGNSGQGISTNWQYDASIATPTITLNQGALFTNAATVRVGVGNDAEAAGWLIGTIATKPAENDPRWQTDKPAWSG
ncbi:MAG: Ig-like domain-containing protein, partial [Candidatus Desantisbacteria bacterium]